MAKNEIKKKTSKRPEKFVKPGFILGIVSVATSIIVVGALIGIPGIVLSALSLKVNNKEQKAKAKKGLIMSIVGTAVGCAVFAVLMVILFVFVLANIGYPGGN